MSRRPQRGAPLNPGRLAVGRALLDTERGAHLEDALEQHAPPDGPDRRLAWHIAFEVTRRRGELDALVGAASSRPVRKLDPAVRAALRVGAWELRLGRAPPHAAVDQAVQLARGLKAAHAAGFVNAVLRKLPEQLEQSPTINHPEWLTRRWTTRYGAEATARWCGLDDARPTLSLVAWQDAEALGLALSAQGLSPRPALVEGVAVPGVLLVDDASGRVPELPGFEEGSFWVMDPAAVAMADLVPVSPGDRVLDACAAPGGKSLRLASRGARVVATDRSEARLERLSASATRLGAKVEARAWDWSRAPLEDIFDAVLVDAPCTGLGTLRRHPEIRWARQPGDPAAMAVQQLSILRNALRAVRPGGALVYSVCSPEPEEGPELVRRVLADTPGVTLELERSTAPPTGDHDAHYGARLRRGGGE